MTTRYLQAVAAEGSVRYHADGRVQQPVTEREREHARFLLGLSDTDPEFEPYDKPDADCYRIGRDGTVYKNGQPINVRGRRRTPW
jgi:hypothetical protein